MLSGPDKEKKGDMRETRRREEVEYGKKREKRSNEEKVGKSDK